MTDPTEASPLAPTLAEVAVLPLAVLDIALVVFVVVQLLRGKLNVPHGIYGWIVLLLVPVVGPLLVLTWRGRVARHREQPQQTTA